MITGLLREPDGENRVALLPEAAKMLIDLKSDVSIESDAGLRSFKTNADYEAVGASIAHREVILSSSDLLIGINPPTAEETERLRPGTVLLSVFQPLTNPNYVSLLQRKQITAFSMDIVPRTTRAQAMDILSSMATVSGYKAVLLAASHLPTFFPMMMTAAGSITPAKVLILGAGVAGLQAIATCRKLGAVVHAFDVRAAAKEEVLSLGAKFVDVEGAKDDKAAGGYAVEQTEDYLQKQRQAIHDQAVKSDVIICTAQIPGRPAPKLLFENTIKAMKPGSVVVDLAASTGGNCEITENERTVSRHGITILGYSNLPSTLPGDASKMFGKNVLNFLKLIVKDGNINLDFQDDIVQGTCVTHQGDLISPRVKQILQNV